MDNFVVSARKYRPATFTSVVGQRHITSTLKNAISRSQLAHAYLFCGPRGVGKTTCARIFAKAINCLSPVDSEACNECESCKGFNEGRSFNIHELDAASNNSVDDIRSLTEQVRIPPQIGRYSVYIIDEVHMLSSSAFNAFLKTLEEPPAHAVFILATTEKHKIIPTILSRCQIFDFNRIRVEDSVEYLKYIARQENVECDDESLHLIALKADGGMRDALSMFDKAVSFCGSSLQYREVARTLNVLDYDTYFKTTDIIVSGDYPAVLTLFDEVLKKGFSPQIFIAGLSGHFRDLLMCKSPQTLPLLEVSGSLLERYRSQAEKCSPELLFSSISLLTSLDGTLRTATNQRLNVELGLMKLCASGQKKTPDLNVTPASHAEAGRLPELRKEPYRPSETAGESTRTADPKEPTAFSVKTEVDETQPAEPAEAHREKPSPGGPSGQTPTREDPSEIRISGKSSGDTGPIVEVEVNEAPPVDTESGPKGKQGESVPAPEKPKRESRASIHAMPQTISGASIQSILSSSKSVHEAAVNGEVAETQVSVDPLTESKITEHREEFIKKLRSKRPRIAMAMQDMTVEGNVVRMSVPTETLYEEIMRNSTEILMMLSDMASIEGFIDLKIEIKADEKAPRPIKAEDKLKYLTEKNPELTLLRQKLGLEID